MQFAGVAMRRATYRQVLGGAELAIDTGVAASVGSEGVNAKAATEAS